MRARSWGPALVCFAVSGVARAEPIHVAYTAPASCPSEEEFRAGVLARTRAEGPARTFVVTLTPGPSESAGHLVVREADGTETERDVVGDTCEEVASALELIAALTIDPNASMTPIAPPVVAAPLPIATPREAPIAVPPRRARWHFGASVGASVAAGIAPAAVTGVPIAVHAIAPFGSTFHLGFERTSSGALDVSGGAAVFTWTVGIVEGCPHRFRWGAFSAEPCVRVEGGALQGQGGRIVPAREDTRGWFALGAVGRAEWLFAGPLFLEVEGGLRAPFVRTTYYFEPDTTIYRAPAVSGIAGIGVGARFL